ncbi:MAG: MtnX-like HAD-IB family phosphatase [Candidatus Omnitrophica bacterium]|nr:MtnX-like HAD-IB family phosphatase [Candidatus Omnitrophota bacterium]
MRKIIVISDFDGTITKKDSLVEILNKFASPKWLNIAKLINKGRLGTRLGLKKEFALCRVSQKNFIDFLNKNITIDITFKNFLKFCKKNRLKLLVVSGGFTLNIETLFKKYGIKNIAFFANTLKFKKDAITIKFPPKDKNCKTCSLCKAPYIRRFKKKGYFTIYIGDSVTDRCPVKVADLVFAKHNLAEYCKAKGINYLPYNTFAQIKSHLQTHILKFKGRA